MKTVVEIINPYPSRRTRKTQNTEFDFWKMHYDRMMKRGPTLPVFALLSYEAINLRGKENRTLARELLFAAQRLI